MIKIRVTSPFRYQYVNGDGKLAKDVHFAAGDYYHLDAKKDKLEAIYVLSPNFPFKNYIHVESETVPADLAQEVGLEAGFYEEYTLPQDEEYIPTLIDKSGQFEQTIVFEDGQPIQDALPNKFDLTSDPDAVPEKVEEIPLTPEEEKTQGALNTPDLEPVELPNEDVEEIESGGIGDRTERKAELESLHYKKVQEVAELYNIDYTNKKETIEAILALEFGDPVTPDTIIDTEG